MGVGEFVWDFKEDKWKFSKMIINEVVKLPIDKVVEPPINGWDLIGHEKCVITVFACARSPYCASITVAQWIMSCAWVYWLC